MSCSSAIYTVFTGQAAAVAGAFLPLGTIVRRYGKNLNQAGDGVILDGAGYYEIDVNVIITGTTGGTVTITLTEDANVIQGGTVSVTTTAGNIYTIPVHAVVRKKCCDNPSTIQVRLATTSAPSTINQVSTIVLKV